MAISPVKDAAGQLIGSSAVFRDLTELNRVSGLQDEARHKDQFLAALSHELRGPLASLQICLDVLQGEGTDVKRGQDALAIAGRQLEHLSALVNQLLDASRIASGGASLKRSDEDLVELVRTSAEEQRALLDAPGGRLHLSLTSTPPSGNCDPHRIRPIVVNLLRDAAQIDEPA